MNELFFAMVIASTFLGAAGLISLVPVSTIQRLLGIRIQKTAIDSKPPIEPIHIVARHELVSTLMKTYLHDRLARDHLQDAATAQNLHPIGPHDVLAQLIFVRRDLNRILHESNLRSQSTIASIGTYRSDYFHSSHESLIPRGEITVGKYFQHNVELSDEGLSAVQKRKVRFFQ